MFVTRFLHHFWASPITLHGCTSLTQVIPFHMSLSGFLSSACIIVWVIPFHTSLSGCLSFPTSLAEWYHLICHYLGVYHLHVSLAEWYHLRCHCRVSIISCFIGWVIPSHMSLSGCLSSHTSLAEWYYLICHCRGVYHLMLHWLSDTISYVIVRVSVISCFIGWVILSHIPYPYWGVHYLLFCCLDFYLLIILVWSSIISYRIIWVSIMSYDI